MEINDGMAAQLNYTIVWSSDQTMSARFLTRLQRHIHDGPRHVRLHPNAGRIAATHYLTAWAISRLGRLFNHLVGSGEKCGRDGEAERLGGIQVDDQKVFQRQLHRKFRRHYATKNVINIVGTTVKYILELSSVREQTTISGDNGCLVDRRNTVPRCQRYY